MKDGDVALAKLTYKCLRDDDGEKDVDIFNENINRLLLKDGIIMFRSELTDGESNVTPEDIKAERYLSRKNIYRRRYSKN